MQAQHREVIGRHQKAAQAQAEREQRESKAAPGVWRAGGLCRAVGDAWALMEWGEGTYVLQPPPAKLSGSVAEFEKNAEKIEQRLATLGDAAGDKNARFLMDGKVAWESPLGDMLFGFLFDAIHHRGQLSSYLRPMGAKVPSIYGPSADDPGT